MFYRLSFALLLCLSLAFAVQAADHRVEPFEEPAPADAVSAEIAATLAPTGVRIVRGEARTVCEIWLCKQLAAQPDFEATSAVQYPLVPGSLLGVVRYVNKGTDFRDQDIARGVYTLRYGQQPVDGNHVGTSPTRDFLLLIEAEKDKSPEVLDLKDLATASAEAAQSSHPALLSLQRPVDGGERAPSIRHNEEHDWWIVRLGGTIRAGDAEAPLDLEFVVVGHAAE
jgi:hypothetical protein